MNKRQRKKAMQKAYRTCLIPIHVMDELLKRNSMRKLTVMYYGPRQSSMFIASLLRYSLNKARKT